MTKLKAIGCGFIGVILALGLYHAYLDHQNLHVLVNWATAQAKAQAKASVSEPGK